MKYDEVKIILDDWDYKDSEEYLEALHNRKIWDNLNHLSDQECRGSVLTFLNLWKCRISYHRSNKLAKSCKRAHVFLSALKHENLLELNLFKKVRVRNERIEVYKVILKIFDILSEVQHVKATAASKIMHLANPNLFVMWDDQIAENYGYSGNSAGYVNFLMRMKVEASKMEKEYSRDKKVKVPLTRLLDIYNWKHKDDWKIENTFEGETV